MLCRSLNCSLVATTGVDGCFIKLTTGAQILAATGREMGIIIFSHLHLLLLDKRTQLTGVGFYPN